MILDALLSSQKHYSVLANWEVVDAGFFIRFIYLSHFYKIKFIKVVQERLMNRCLNKYTDESMFKDGRCTLFKTAFSIIISSMKDLSKISTIVIFTHIYLEIMSKNIFFVLLHFREMVRHPANAMTDAQMRLVITELGGLDQYLTSILEYTELEYKVEIEAAKRELRLNSFRHLRLDTIQAILDIFICKFRDRLRTEFRSVFAMKPLRERLQQVLLDFQDNQEIAPDFAAKFQEKQINTFMHEYLEHLLTKSNETLRNEIKQVELDARWFLEHFKRVPFDSELKFFECLRTYLESPKRSECWEAVSLMSGLISPPLKRSDILTIIGKKIFDPKKDFEEKLRSQVNEHFRKFNLAQQKRNTHLSISRKFFVMGLQLLFIVRCKRQRAAIGTTLGYNGVKRALQNLEERDKSQSVEGFKNTKVRVIIFSKSQIKNTYAGFPLSVLWGNQLQGVRVHQNVHHHQRKPAVVPRL